MLAIVAAVVVGALALAGAIYALTRSDTDDTVNSDVATTEPTIDTAVPASDSTEPGTETIATEPVDTEPAATEPPVTDPAVTTPPTEPATSDVVGATEPDSDDDLTAIDQLLAWTSFAEDPLDDSARQAEIDRLLVEKTVEAVAHPTRVSTICAGIPVNAALDFDIVWQFAGETVQTDTFSAAPPGVGSCIDNAGEPLAAGSYQVFAANDDESVVGFATTFVVGASEITQTFINNTDADICEVGVAPIDTAYYELFVIDPGPLAPGELLTIPIAAVEQDLSARYCDGTDVGALVFLADASATQNLSL